MSEILYKAKDVSDMVQNLKKRWRKKADYYYSLEGEENSKFHTMYCYHLNALLDIQEELRKLNKKAILLSQDEISSNKLMS